METDTHEHRAWVAAALAHYERPLLRYAQRLTGNPDRARDLVQDTFLQLCRADRTKVAPHLAPWLYRVCRNRALDVMQKELRMYPLSEGMAAARPSAAPDPAMLAADGETGQRIRAAIATLPAKQQECFRLKFHDGLSYQEITEVTGQTLSNVRYFIHTALKAVRADLAELRDGAPGTPQEIQ